MASECPLTNEQIDVVRWQSHGKSYREIAEILGISPKAAVRRVERAWQTTGTFNKTGLVAMALRKGWIQ
jgi:DNA-binding CsgD family transcriptional regulator